MADAWPWSRKSRCLGNIDCHTRLNDITVRLDDGIKSMTVTVPSVYLPFPSLTFPLPTPSLLPTSLAPTPPPPSPPNRLPFPSIKHYYSCSLSFIKEHHNQQWLLKFTSVCDSSLRCATHLPPVSRFTVSCERGNEMSRSDPSLETLMAMMPMASAPAASWSLALGDWSTELQCSKDRDIGWLDEDSLDYRITGWPEDASFIVRIVFCFGVLTRFSFRQSVLEHQR